MPRQRELKDIVLTHDGVGKITIRRGDMVIAAATVKIDPTKKPKTTDATYAEGDKKGKTVLGIYEIEGDTLRVRHGSPGADRPTEFSAKAGSGNVLIVYKREKK